MNRLAGTLSLFRRGGRTSSVGGLRERAAAVPKTDFGSSAAKGTSADGPKKWLAYNDVVYPPQAPGEETRPAVSRPVKFFFLSG